MWMEITLFFVAAGGVFLWWYSLGSITLSRRQLAKPVEYRILRNKADGFLEKRIQSVSVDSPSFQRIMQKWSMWSEIGTGQPLSLFSLLTRSVTLGVLLATGCALYTHSVLMTALFLVVGISWPVVRLKARFANVAYRARRKGFLPFVDVYRHAYVQAKENIITAFHLCVQDCPKEMQPVLSWLLRRLHNGSSQKEGIREFAMILRSEFAHTFANYLISGLEGEAENIRRPLISLQLEMHSTRDEEEERDMITMSAFVSNFLIIGLSIMGVLFLVFLLHSMKVFFLQSDAGHSLLAFALVSWIVMISYSYFQMKGGNL